MSGQRAPPPPQASRPNHSPHPTYNPQDYASPQSPQYSPQQYSPHAPPPPPPPRDQFRPYNPAAYQDNSIANAANQLYGSAAAYPQAGLSPYQAPYSPNSQSQHGYSPRSPSSQYSAQMSPDVSSYRSHRYSASVPHPQPQPPPQRQYTASTPDGLQSQPSRTTYFQDPPYPQQQTIPAPTLPAPPAPPQHHSPSPDFTQSYMTHGRDGSEGLNITSAFPRPPMPATTSTHESSYTSTARNSGSRPLPSVPQAQRGRSETFYDDVPNDRTYSPPDNMYENDQIQQDLFNQVETALNLGSLAPGPSSNRNSDTARNYHRPQSYGTYYNEYGDEDSDAEAQAGLEAMRMAEKQEHEDIRRRTLSAHESAQAVAGANGQYSTDPRLEIPEEEPEYEDEDYGAFDIGAFSGGFGMDMPYQGGARASDALTATQELQNGLNAHPSVSSRGTAQTDMSGSTLHTDTQTSMTSLSTAGVRASARVDESGTGGLTDPAPPRRQMSFDADDVAERQYFTNEDNYPIPETYYPPMHQVSSRPLPAVPMDSPALTDANHLSPNLDAFPHPQNTNLHMDVPSRSQSLGYHSTVGTQHSIAPARAKTDAEERTKRMALRGQNTSQSSFSHFVASENLDLPALPTGRRLQPSKLVAAQYDRCQEPWALSAITEWLRFLADGDSELRRAPVEEVLVNLFTTKIPTLNIATAESLSVLAVNEMIAVGALIQEEEWIRFGDGLPSGVLFQLTNKGCYAQVLHESEGAGRCYSHHCQRTERKVDLATDKDSTTQQSWAEFWKLSKEDIEGRDKKELELQNNLHEIITSEYNYMRDLNVLKTLYRDGLLKRKDIMSPKMVGDFVENVFGKLDAVQKANEDYLLPQLKYRQKEQGPWIVGFSDIFRDWIRKAKNAYIEYTANFPSSEFAIKQEMSRNLLFRTFVDEMRNDPSANRLDIWHYLKAPIGKIQRYSLLLQTVQKNMKQESEEKANLAIAIAEVREATSDCNARLAEEARKIDLLDLKAKLHLRPEMKHVELNLTQWGRELIFQGDVQRTGQSRFTWLETKVILLDNYLVLAKESVNRETKAQMYDVSKMPVPMDLLVLESAEDDPIVKSTMKGIAVGTATTRANMPTEARLARTNTGTPVGNIALSPTNTSGPAGMVTSTSLEPSSSRDENILYPFRVRHLGKEVYTLYASTSSSRKDWADKIIEAKTRHAASLFSQNAEPFKLKVVADTAFSYEQTVPGQKGIMIKGTPLHRAIEEVERQYAAAGRPAPVCRARVNCATTFKQPDGRIMTAIGTDYGVYLSEANNPRGWTRAIPSLRVTQLAVLEEFGLFLLISDKSLIAYHLDVVLGGTSANSSSDSLKKAPQKLSGAKDVGFFATGRMKDRTLVFYEKRDGRSSVFKILEPVYKKSTPMARSRHWGFRGHTDFFRDYDDFYIPTDCSALDLFPNTLSVATARGFEILNLEKKTPWSVPDLKAPHVATIAARLHGLEPVAMFRLAADGSELLCVYEECAVYVNKYGDVSRSVVMEFVGRAKNASLLAGYLVLFDADFVEVRDAYNGRLKQVVSGRDVRCLDSGRGQGQSSASAPGTAPGAGNATAAAPSERSVKFALAHPENERAQIVVELVLNQDRRV